MTIRVRPITEVDLPAVADFLHRHLNHRIPPQVWEQSVRVPWKVDAPDHGRLLADGDEVVGVYLAFYSERVIDGRPERFCNLGAWCVLPPYRFHAARLLRSLLAQPDVHFTDLSPSGPVVPIGRRHGFRRLDTTTALVPHLPWPWRSRHELVTSDAAAIERTLTGSDLQIYRDHAGAAAAHHVLLVRGDRYCYVMFRRDRRKGLPVFATILYASDHRLWRQMALPFGDHLLRHHRLVASLVPRRTVPCPPPPWSVRLRSPRPMLYRSAHLPPDRIDHLYSELVCVPW